MKRSVLLSCVLLLILVVVVAARIAWLDFWVPDIHTYGTPFCTNPDDNGKPAPGCYAPEYADLDAALLAPVSVDACQLVNNPMLYDRKNVRIRAVSYINGDERYFYDPACDGENKRMGMGFSSPTMFHFDLVAGEPSEGARRARVDVVGTFHVGSSGVPYELWFYLRRIENVAPLVAPAD